MATSVDIPIYDPSQVIPISGNTPFGLFDADPLYQTDGPKFAVFAARKLGYPIMDVELQYVNFYAALEEAIMEYGTQVYNYKIRENYISFEGASSQNPLDNAVINPSLGAIIRIAGTYGSEAGVGGTTPFYTAALPLNAFQQRYDLNAWASSSLGISESIEIKKVFYEAPPAIVRFFDPYIGTGIGLQSLLNTFGFGALSPGISFMLMPINYDVLTIQAIEFNDQIRRSAYSFNIVDNQLTIFPLPTFDTSLYIKFIKVSDRNSPVFSNSTGSISNISNVPYESITWSLLNFPSRRWIFEYALCIVKEILGNIRGKYQALPIPGDQVSLNGQSLIDQAKAEKDKLIEDLQEMLDEVSRTKQLAKKADEGESLRSTLSGTPLPFFIM